jgi:protein-arginine kinase
MQYHGHDATRDLHPAENPNDRLNAPDFPPDEAAMIRSTRIRVGRNLDGFPLGPGIYNPETRAQIEGMIVKALNSFTGELQGTYYPLYGMSPQVQKQLIEDHFLFKEGDRFLEACRINENWPHNRGIFHNPAKTFLTWVNEEDQLRIISMQQGSNIRQTFERL